MLEGGRLELVEGILLCWLEQTLCSEERMCPACRTVTNLSVNSQQINVPLKSICVSLVCRRQYYGNTRYGI